MISRDSKAVAENVRSVPDANAPFANNAGSNFCCGTAVLFPCPEGFAFGYLTGKSVTTDEGIRMSEVRLRNGHTFVLDELVTVVPNEASVIPLVGEC